MSNLHPIAEEFLEQGRNIEDRGPPSVVTKACMLYRVAGKAECYGTLMLDAKGPLDYEPCVGPDCMKAAGVLARMAERLLGWEKPETTIEEGTR